MRVCAVCNEPKPVEDFKHRRAKCRDCYNGYRREWFNRPGPAQDADRARPARTRDNHQEATLITASNRGEPWDQEQDLILLENWGMTSRELAEVLNRTWDAINNRKKKLKRAGHLHEPHVSTASP